jgi:hypothetical protein
VEERLFSECFELDAWDDLLDLLLPDEDGCVAVIRAYIDASERKEMGLFSVAGFLFDSGRVRGFRKEWNRTFGGSRFSWADLIARSKPFDHLRGREHDDEHAELVRTGVRLVRDNCLSGTTVSIWTQDIENFSPRYIKGFSQAYSICTHMCAWGLGKLAKQHRLKGGIAYVLEAGDEYADEANHLLSLRREGACHSRRLSMAVPRIYSQGCGFALPRRGFTRMGVGQVLDGNRC